MKTIAIMINKDDLKLIKVGINKLYELTSRVIGETYNEKYSGVYDLYSFMYEKLKFEDVE